MNTRVEVHLEITRVLEILLTLLVIMVILSLMVGQLILC